MQVPNLTWVPMNSKEQVGMQEFGDFMSKFRDFRCKFGGFRWKFGDFTSKFGGFMSKFEDFRGKFKDFTSKFGDFRWKFGDSEGGVWRCRCPASPWCLWIVRGRSGSGNSGGDFGISC